MNSESRFVATENTQDWVSLFLILLFALGLRLILFTGFFGSDEVTYTQRAVAWLLGDRSIPEYVGANRLGITLPVAAIMGVFGRSEFTANLWSLFCSIGELTLVWLMAMRLGGRSLAVAATLLLALTPLHIHYSGRLLADSPVSFFMTLSAAGILIWRNDRFIGAIVSGAAAGFVFWIKQPVVVFSLAIIALMILERRPWRHFLAWGIAAASIASMNLAITWIYAGDPFFILKAMSRRMAVIGEIENANRSAHAYLYWLFLDIRFTWLLGWFALLGLISGYSQPSLRISSLKVLVWLVSLIMIFSLWPASLNPIEFIFKQSNYMVMFLSPAALAGGFLLVQLKLRFRVAMFAVFGCGGIFLGALQQADIQVFSANAREIPNFIHAQPEHTYYIGTEGRMAVIFENVLTAKSLEDFQLDKLKPLEVASSAMIGESAMIILDPISGPHRNDPRITEDWPNAKCWQPVDTIAPSKLGFVAGAAVSVVRIALSALPIDGLRLRANNFMAMPPASVLRLDRQCEVSQGK